MSGIFEGEHAAMTFRWNEAAIHQTFFSPYGPVAKDLARRAIKVESAAKLNASGRPGPKVQTGRLRASIAWRIVPDPEGLAAEIGTNVEYAYYLEVTGVGAAQIRYPFLKPALPAAGGGSIAPH